MGHPVVKESQRPIQPFFAPPLPSEASTLAGSYEMAPNLLLDLVSDIREPATQVVEREVVNPAANKGLIASIHLFTGSEREHRKISLS